MVLTLYKLNASPPVRAVLMTIEALKLSDIELVDVNVLEGAHMKEEYLKMNPQHTVPMLKDDDFIVWDSHAIGVYLITKYGQDESLYPSDPQKRALIDQRLHFDSGILFPALRGTVAPIFFGTEKELRPENKEKLKNAFDFTEKFLTSDWMVGDDITLADIACVASISTMNELLPINSGTYPNISAWLNRCSQQDFYKKANEPGLAQFRAVLKSKLG